MLNMHCTHLSDIEYVIYTDNYVISKNILKTNINTTNKESLVHLDLS